MKLPDGMALRGPDPDLPETPWRAHPCGPRVDSVVQSWIDTPYGAGQAEKGVAVDCVRFVAATLFELRDLDGPRLARQLKRLPMDAALHSKFLAIGAVRIMLRKLAPWTKVEDTNGYWEPGDVVVQHTANNAPTHAAIVTSVPETLAHATPDGVKLMTVSSLDGAIRLYRPTDKGAW